MVDALSCQSTDPYWMEQASDAVDLDGGDYPDNRSSSSGSSSDDGSSQDSISSISSVSSVCSSTLDESGLLSSLALGGSTHSLSSHGNKNQSGPVRSWMDTVNNAASSKALPIEQRQNPRRTGLSSSASADTKQPPCSLVRQDQRKDCFVAILVNFAAQFVEAIWPLAACTPRTDTCFFGRGVLPLRTFITETLRRSRTSYSTLQVALFYLVLIKNYLPSVNLCMEQPTADESFRSMQCGRRMFLTALILASKYLQDRNYSTRAWSKISGLRAKEIHINEMHYCRQVKWNLHIPQEKFQRWSRIVLRLSAPAAGPGSETLAQQIGWPVVLSKLDESLSETFENFTKNPRSPDLSAFSPSANFTFGDNSNDKQGLEHFKGIFSTEASAGNKSSEPVAQYAPAYPTSTLSQPPLPRLQNLPTPQTTPQTHAFKNFCNSQPTPSMSMAMSQAKQTCWSRATLDRCPPPTPSTAASENSSPERVRRSSLSKSTSSLASSPESMISDTSSVTRASRSSSISSVSSSLSVSVPTKLNRLACRRAAGLTDSRRNLNDLYKTQGVQKPEWTTLPSLDELNVRTPSRSASPQLSENPTQADQNPSKRSWSTKPNFGLQDLEAAAALCKLRPMFSEVHGTENTPPRTSVCKSSENTPLASRLNGFAGQTSCEQSPFDITPKVSQYQGVPQETVLPQKCHKRSHSNLAESLQDNVRAQLRSKLPLELPDRSISLKQVEMSPRGRAAQSPTMTFGVSKTPIPVKNYNGSKRTCSAANNQVSAADLAAQYLRSGISRIPPISLVNTPS